MHSHVDWASGPLPLHTPTMDPDHREPAAPAPKSKKGGGTPLGLMAKLGHPRVAGCDAASRGRRV